MPFVTKYISQLTVVEDIASTGPVGNSQTTYSAFNRDATIQSNAVSPAVPVTKRAFFEFAMTGGSGSLDLTSLSHNDGDATETVDMTGLKVQFARFTAPTGNSGAITISDGASNGYEIFGDASGQVTISPGQSILLELAESADDVGASDKTIDLSGTGTDSVEYTILAG